MMSGEFSASGVKSRFVDWIGCGGRIRTWGYIFGVFNDIWFYQGSDTNPGSGVVFRECLAVLKCRSLSGS
jgi:hypothetical protein